mmetsp:Transcript_12536/g.20095  ORF Transcript_12536/g.20095 Transcript_12536/m.20095 type:complete len:508 (+) Transcript_12536:149-1672(+)
MAEITKEYLLEFKTQIKMATLIPAAKYKNTVPEIDVAKNIAICDKLTVQPALAWRAERTIRKIALGKDDVAAILAMNLADMIVKNCPRFRLTMNTKLFSNGLVKTLPKHIRNPQGRKFHTMQDDGNPAKVERISKTLLLIQQWAGGVGHHWKQAYEDLKLKNCQFPVPHKNEVSALDFDDTKVPAKTTARTAKTSGGGGGGGGAFTPTARVDGKERVFADSQCKQAAALFEVLNDMLRAKPENPARNPMIQELKGQCENLQKQVQGRLGANNSPQIMDELLKVNDLFNNLTKLYRNVIAGKDIAPPPSREQQQQPKAKKEPEKKIEKKQDVKDSRGGDRVPRKEEQKRDNGQQDLLGLADLFLDGNASAANPPGGANAIAISTNNNEQKDDAPAPVRGNTFDLLNNVFGGGQEAAPTATATVIPTTTPSTNTRRPVVVEALPVVDAVVVGGEGDAMASFNPFENCVAEQDSGKKAVEEKQSAQPLPNRQPSSNLDDPFMALARKRKD